MLPFINGCVMCEIYKCCSDEPAVSQGFFSSVCLCVQSTVMSCLSPLAYQIVKNVQPGTVFCSEVSTRHLLQI